MPQLRQWLPTGESLDDGAFAVRHRLVTNVLWPHIPLLFVFGLARHYSVAHTLADLAPVLVFAAASRLAQHRVTQTMAASAALLSCSGVLIHLTGGVIEAHLHVYVALVLVALYVDWRPYAVAVFAVLVHHIGVGLVAPETVFVHVQGQNKPILWASIHATFAIAESLVIAVLWRFTTQDHERMLALMRSAEAIAGERAELEARRAGDERRHAAEVEDQLRQQARVRTDIERESSQLDDIIGRLGESMHLVSDGIEELSASVDEIARSSKQAATVASSASRQAEVSKSTVAGLAEVSRRIGGLVETIGGVAKQTNLLALNASIEAARAGEAGRGFAVVASEVKELAAQAGQVADQVAGLVASVQERTGDAVTHLEQIAGVIEEIDQLQQSIAAATDQQAESTRVIAGTAVDVAGGAELIADSVRRLNELSRHP